MPGLFRYPLWSLCQAAGRGLTAFSKPMIQSPKNVVMPLVDREQRAVAIRALVQCPRDAIVMLHHETENAVHMIGEKRGGGRKREGSGRTAVQGSRADFTQRGSWQSAPSFERRNYHSAITAVLSSLSCRAPLRVIPGSVRLFRKRFNSVPGSRPREHGISTKASL